MKPRVLLLVQLLGTLAILAWLPSNLGKLAAMLGLWLLTFGKLRRTELVLFPAACLYFSVMDVLTVQRGQFHFNHPDLLGLPAFEFVMWGFYLLHAWRMIGGPVPARDWKPWVLAILFAACFTVFTNPTQLSIATAALLAVAFCFYHQRHDWLYFGYLVLLGAVVEYTGVLSGQWGYPGENSTSVPLWFMTMWGGVGLFLRRLVLPNLIGLDRKLSQDAASDCETALAERTPASQ